jgi:hypothetical protein
MKYGLNRINIRLFTLQVVWCGGKGIKLHPCGSRIKFHKCYALWSTLDYWQNILCLFRLPKLGGYLGKPKYIN